FYLGPAAFQPQLEPTHQCLQDIMDGYFPSELQPRYPDGVPLQASASPAPGATEEGLRSVGLCRCVWHPGHLQQPLQETFQHQGSRAPLSLGLTGLCGRRGRAAEQAGAPELCRLRVRSESGEQTYELRMLLTDTIGDLRRLLAHLRGGNSDYEILSTFPQRVYTDSSRSLQECGLVPRASLLLRRRDPSPGQGRGLQPA
uniref:UBX domain protein 11 n=1 Tax=Zonotrichia albicollis TaxID=44394 RepID=A0A8D2MJT4_ZONAL